MRYDREDAIEFLQDLVYDINNGIKIFVSISEEKIIHDIKLPNSATMQQSDTGRRVVTIIYDER